MRVTVQEYWSTAIAVFVFGLLAGWAVFGRPRALDTLVEQGSVADWMAAAGTWVIGYMAWSIARKTQRHHEAVEEGATRKQELRDAADLLWLCNEVFRAITCAVAIEKTKLGDINSAWATKCRISIKILSKLEMSRSVLHLVPSETVHLYDYVTMDIMELLDTLEQAEVHFSGQPEMDQISEGGSAWKERLIESSRKLAKDATPFAKKLEAMHLALRDRK